MPRKATIEEIMSKDVYSVNIDDTIHKADEIMRDEHVRHIPVVEGDKYIGLITERSLMEYTLRQLYDYDDEYGESGYNKISDFQEVMTRDVQVVYPEDSVQKAIEILAKKKIDCLPVVDWHGKLLGIITVIDIILFMKNILDLENALT